MSIATSSSLRDHLWPVVTVRFLLLAVGLSVVAVIMPAGSVWLRLLIINGLLGLVTVADARLGPRPSSVDVERSFPAVLAMGTESELTWVVSNPSRRPLHVSVADELPDSFGTESRRFSFVVSPLGQRHYSCRFRPQARGRFDIAELTVRTRGPLGLGGRIGSRHDIRTMRVYPSFDSRREAELRLERAQMLDVGTRSVRRRGGGTEFDQLREYGVDDDYRRIDWAATARANKAIVRTYRAEENQNVFVLLDCGRSMAARVAGTTRFEYALDAVQAIATIAGRLGDRVGLVAFDDEIRAEVGLGHGPGQVVGLTNAVFDLHPRLRESDFRNAFVRMMSRSTRRCLVIVLSEPDAYVSGETLIPALPVVTRHHMVVVAGVADPDVSRWARSVPVDVERAHQKAAAIGALVDRRNTAVTIGTKGAAVVDAVPGTLALRVADFYLEAKASGRL